MTTTSGEPSTSIFAGNTYRTIWLRESGKQLIQWPVVEIEKLRANLVNWPTKLLKGGELLQVNGVTAAQVCFTCCRTSRVIVLYL